MENRVNYEYRTPRTGRDGGGKEEGGRSCVEPSNVWAGGPTQTWARKETKSYTRTRRWIQNEHEPEQGRENEDMETKIGTDTNTKMIPHKLEQGR